VVRSASELGATARPLPRAIPCEVTIVANDIGPVGGMERALSRLVRGLHDLGHRVTVIARTYDAPALAGVSFRRVRGPRRPALLASPWFLIAGTLAVRRWRRGVVQTTGAIVANRVDVIAVHYCHQVGPANPSRSNWLYSAHARVLAVLNRASERLWFTARDTTTFVCVSDGVAEEVKTHYPEVAARVVRIYNGVDTSAFAPGLRVREATELRARLGIDTTRLIALFVGSEWNGKGLAQALRALVSSPRWELLVAGRGDRERFDALARCLDVADRVHWIGVTRDVQTLYELADAFVLPSEYETFSLVTFEAAASGLPILATAVSGVRELIRDGENGYLITREPEVIAERLQRLAADARLRTRLGAAAREAALRFSWEKMVMRHHDLYEQLSGGTAEAATVDQGTSASEAQLAPRA
jgi:glycosyltransferase involved in cell wall biosynthesis